MLSSLRVLTAVALAIIGSDGAAAWTTASGDGDGTLPATAKIAEESLEQGNEWLATGDADRAIDAYQRGLERLKRPGGTSSAESGTPSRSYGQLVTELSLHTNLATALSSLGRDDAAIDAYRDALAAYRSNRGLSDSSAPTSPTEEEKEAALVAAQASFYLGMMFQDSASELASASKKGEGSRGAVREAIDAYAYALELDPLHWSAAANLGSLYHDVLLDYDKALEAYNHAYSILTSRSNEPTDPPPEPRFVLSQLQYRIGLCLSNDPSRKCQVVADGAADGAGRDTPSEPSDCGELAANAFATAVEYDPGNEAAKHMLATLTADATVKRASNEYVTTLFDEYARNFEHSLVNELGYNGYERLRRAFDRAFGGSPPVFQRVVDAGCGTGLVGAEFRNVSRALVGVDLSQSILDQAILKRPKLYDETIAKDVTELLRERRGTIDLIVAGDSFIYFGDLDPLFDALKQGLDYDGYVAFSLEDVDLETENALMTSKPDWRWQLTASGRFAHRKEYVVNVGSLHGLQLIHYERMDGFRHERGVQVRGHIFILRNGRPDQEL
jgi:predicted TPR repeat methyltransferase